jgi:hypothetical protein
MAGLVTVPVTLGERSYDVLVGRGARHELAGVLPAAARRAVVVTQAGIPLPVDPGLSHEVVVPARSTRRWPRSRSCAAASPASV